MQVVLSRWGNSLGLRVPKDIAARLGLTEGSKLEIEAEDDRIVITTAALRYRLEDLLVGITPEAMSEAFDWGPDLVVKT